MQGQMETKYGKITIDTDVIATYAGSVAVECFGIVGMATISMTDGLAKLLKGSNISKGVNVRINDDNAIIIDFHIIISYGVNIRAVVDNLKKTVKYQVEDYTSLNVKTINVFVEGVRVID